MSSVDHEMANALVVTHSPRVERRLRGGIIVAIYFLGVVVVMGGWLYLLSRLLMVGISKFAELAAYVVFE
ncbi:hypothetical protein [Bradyrhizobium sp. JYMT SZCCT0428]|uniref:hypothetical protein n=1 Tax=Bradyrhizobium sp. JYMT SZCCT0428 TaxID=2807673 RepID=UPI001BA999FB|nr:hypothetical protein [Bradyrhizobium sp. JYMT SZCCT0428]MBR1157021.1 hypothetical protein [Bradyrhizobium sp. JYMT SZCCT0428]